MNLKDIAVGTEVFIDANIFIYHFTGGSEECTNLLIRCEEGELNGCTSMNIMLEVMHRLMMVEAVQKRLLNPPNLIRKLQEKPEKIKMLNEYYLNASAIMDMGIRIYPLFPEILHSSQLMRSRYGLLINDSVIAALMKEEGIQNLASNDDTFSRLDWIKLYKPNDIQ